MTGIQPRRSLPQRLASAASRRAPVAPGATGARMVRRRDGAQALTVAGGLRFGTGTMYLVDDIPGLVTPATLAGGATLDVLGSVVDSGSDPNPSMTLLAGSPYQIEVGAPGIYLLQFTMQVAPANPTDFWEFTGDGFSFEGGEKLAVDSGVFHWEFSQVYRATDDNTIGPVRIRNRSASTGNIETLNVTGRPLVA